MARMLRCHQWILTISKGCFRALNIGQYSRATTATFPAARHWRCVGSHGSDFTANSRPESRSYEPRVNTTDSDYESAGSFITAFYSQDPTSAAFTDTVPKILDAEGFLRTMVVVNLLGSWDSYYLNSQNYFLHLAVDDSGKELALGTFTLNDMDSLWRQLAWPEA